MSGVARDSYRPILRLGVPMVLSSAVGMAAQLAVTGLIGGIGDGALYVRSVYTPVAFLFLAVTTGLGVVLQVVVAQAHGRGEREAVAPYLGSVARVGILAFVLLGLALALLGGPLADLMHTLPDRQDDFRRFLLAMTGTTLLGLLGELCSATLRGLGRGGAAARVTVVYIACYLGLIGLGAFVLDGGLMAVPAAGTVAALVEIGLGLWLLVRSGDVALAALTGRRAEVPRLVGAIGVPVGASYLVLFVTNLLLLRIVAPSGPDAVAGFNVGYTLQTAVVVPAVGFGSAVAILMNQRLGAGDPAAAGRVHRHGLRIALGAYAVLTVVVLTAGGPLADLLSGDPHVAVHAREFLSVVGPTFGCTGVTLMVLTVLEQIGHGPLAITLNAVYFTAVVVVAEVLVDGRQDLSRLYWTMAGAAVTGLVAGVPAVARLAARPRALRPAPEPAWEKQS
ncbi:MAG TPA: MATE family efflux transporter [Streptomyces sp.]